MFHELLMSLYGIPGAIFRVDEQGGFEVTKNLPFMHPSEAELLNKLCKLGSYYRKFRKFIDKYSADLSSVEIAFGKDTVEGSKNLHGQYIHAFCAGVSSALRPYQSALVAIEKKVMDEPYTPLSYVYQGLENYFFIFPTLENLINTMEGKKYHGCRILDLLYEAANCGIPSVKEVMDKILHTCHGVLFKQLSAWMLYGLLLDEYQEFFIRDVKKNTSKPSEEDETDYGSYITSSTVLRGVSGRTILEELQLEDEPLRNQETTGISIEHSMLPSYIPNRVAEKIQFIGQSVRMLKDTESLKIHHYINKFGDILQGREKEFLQTLHKLQTQPHFSVPSLETEIDKIKACVAEQLWKLVVEDADLFRHLKLLKEMYLLGRGELYLTFIDHAYNMMKGPASNNVAYDINATFKQSLAKILTYSEEYEELFEMKMEIGSKDDDKDPNVVKTNWDYLKIEYTPPWPLHLLFTPPVMEKFGSLFTFLLRVRRAQIELQNIWALQMSANRSRKEEQGPGATWGLRRQMAFFVDNLQYYLQVDVLETQFTFLLEKIKKTHNFQAIHIALDHFLIEMQKQSFISMSKVFSILNKSLQICMSFCELVKMSKDHWEEKEKTKTIELETIFEKQTSLLFKILSNARIHQTSPHLAQLLLRIDFNKYFTKNSVFDLD